MPLSINLIGATPVTNSWGALLVPSTALQTSKQPVRVIHRAIILLENVPVRSENYSDSEWLASSHPFHHRARLN